MSSTEIKPATSVIGRLSSFDSDTLIDALLSDIRVVQAYMMLLEDHERNFIIRLLSIKEPVSWKPCLVWFGGDHKKLFAVITRLRILQLLEIRNITSGDGGSSVSGISKDDSKSQVSSRTSIAATQYALHRSFRKTLGKLLFQQNAVLPNTPKHAKHLPSTTVLFHHSLIRWNTILSWMVMEEGMAGDAADNFYTPTPDVISVFANLELVVKGKDGVYSLGPDAFQWLLVDLKARIQILFSCFLDIIICEVAKTDEANKLAIANLQPPKSAQTTASRGKAVNLTTEEATSITKAASFILSIANSKIGQAFSTGNLGTLEMRALTFAYDLGLLWSHRPQNPKHVYTSPLAVLLQGSSVASKVASNALTFVGGDDPASTELPLWLMNISPFFYDPTVLTVENSEPDVAETLELAWNSMQAGIIVESNFKVYSYTASQLHLSILSFLCDIRVITKEMTMGLLTRESVLKAYAKNITALQVIKFLEANVHPGVKTKRIASGHSLVPENVATQLIMWEKERNRLFNAPASLFVFDYEDDLDHVATYITRAESSGWMLAASDLPPHPKSKEFPVWKEKTLENMRGKGGSSRDNTKKEIPFLVVSAANKDNMVRYIKSRKAGAPVGKPAGQKSAKLRH